MKKIIAYFSAALLLLGVFIATPVLAEESITLDTQSEESTEIVDVNNDLTQSNQIEEVSISNTTIANEDTSNVTNTLSATETTCTNIMPTGVVTFANATLIVPEGACPIMVSFSSYTFASTIVPYDQQVLVDNITGTYGPGTYNIGPLHLECNWQTDLYVGPVQEHLLAVGGHDQTNGPVLGYNYMENQTCDGTPASVTVDVKANGSDGPITINNGDSYTYTWNSTLATSCLQTSPINSGIALAGDSGPVASSSGAFYPGTTTPVTITVTCTNGTSTSTDSVVINLAPDTSGCSVIMPTGVVNFAMATLVVPEGACPIKVSFSSYTFASTIVPYDQQILVDNITATYGPGTYSIGPLKLECNWQTDLYVGDVQEHLLAIGGHDQSKGPVLGYNYMENQVCGNANIVVTKIVINDNGGTKLVSDFPLFVGTTTVASGATTTFAVGTYKVSETFNSSLYAQTFSGDCDSNGNITLTASTTKTCVITNNDINQGSNDNDDDNDGGSSRRRHRGGGIVRGINTEPEPQVLGVTFIPTTPGLPNTGTGPLTTAGNDANTLVLIFLGAFTLIALNAVAVYSVKRRIL